MNGKCYSYVFILLLIGACTQFLKKSEFVCFNKVDLKLTFDSTIVQEKDITSFLKSYHDKFMNFYDDAFEKLDDNSGVMGYFSKLSGSIFKGIGLTGLEKSQKKLSENYNKEIVSIIENERKKINILIYYTYYERIQYYKETKKQEFVHPRFFKFSYSKDDKNYEKFIEKSSKSLRKFEMKLAQVRRKKALLSLYQNSTCDLGRFVDACLEYIDNPESTKMYEFEMKNLGLDKIMAVWTIIDEKLEAKMKLWNENKTHEFQEYKTSYFSNLKSELHTLEVDISTESKYYDFFDHKEEL
jgi:hypothetical protein